MPKKEDSLLPTQCNQEFLKFHPLDKREVRGGFDGGAITSDAGGLRLREANSLVWTGHGYAPALRAMEIVGRSECFQPRSAESLWPEKPTLCDLKR